MTDVLIVQTAFGKQVRVDLNQHFRNEEGRLAADLEKYPIAENPWWWEAEMCFPATPAERAAHRVRQARPIRSGDNDLRPGEVGGPGTQPYDSTLPHRPYDPALPHRRSVVTRSIKEYLP